MVKPEIPRQSGKDNRRSYSWLKNSAFERFKFSFNIQMSSRDTSSRVGEAQGF